ncbi:MAG TPA: N-acetyltransferase family protein [Deltaproteobacteria bacterium]|nr:N-acetyltransferase family protein [Deltaproteobacteria bacterium]
MDYTIRPMSADDHEPVMAIFNHYVEHSFAAYPEHRLDPEAFDMFRNMAGGNPAASIVDRDGAVVGFGMIRAYNPMPAFAQTAEATYFIHPDHTGKGIGKMLLHYLEQGGREKGIRILLANISSLNPGSIAFHRRNGFTECGRFRDVGMKNGRCFDVVWMQKMI